MQNSLQDPITTSGQITGHLNPTIGHSGILSEYRGLESLLSLLSQWRASSARSTIVPDPGNTLGTAYNVGSLSSTPITLTDAVSSTDISDFYRFTLTANSNFNLSLTDLSTTSPNDADVRLIRDGNNNGIVDSGDVIASSIRGVGQSESINLSGLAAGTYFVQVYQYAGTTNYTLTLSTAGDSSDPGNTLGTAEVENSASFSRNEQVSTSDSNDFYRFTVAQSGIFTANLTGLTGDADVRLIGDSNNNGQIDQGDVQAWQWERGTTSESIRDFITAGTYFVQVMSYNNQTANYSLATNFTAAASDNRSFSIEVNFGQGLDGLSQSARNAITQAADFWENVISYSSFNGPQTLTIDLSGLFSNDNWLAQAGPDTFARAANGRLLPVSGVSTINTRYLSDYNSNPDYLGSIMTHEFGHILGIGTLWEYLGRRFVNRSTGTYNANTYAGWYYGELLGTYTQTAVPVATGIGSGSDYGHWSESVFNTELMTPIAESPGTPTPLSQLTIASLRDIGYNVNYGAAQPYTLPGSSSSVASLLSSLIEEVLNL